MGAKSPYPMEIATATQYYINTPGKRIPPHQAKMVNRDMGMQKMISRETS